MRALLQNYCCFANLYGGHYLFEILYTLLTVKASKKIKKVDVSKNYFDREHEINFKFITKNYFEMKEGYKVSWVKMLMSWYITRESVFI